METCKGELTLKYFLLFTILLFSALPKAEAEEAQSPFSFTVGMQMGMFYGGMDELVYQKGQSNETSRLEWEEHFVPYVDLRTQFNFWNFFACVSLITSIPVKSGSMRDFDYTLPDKTTVSHYSEHDAMFDKHLEIYPEIGGGVDVGNWYFGGSVGFLYRTRKWSAVNGFTQYPPAGQPWSASLPKTEQVGTIITYEESLWAPVLNLYVDYAINDQFSLGFLGSWYPYLNISTIDTHILRQTRFEDEMKGGNGVLAEITLMYLPKTSDIVAFMFGVGYEGMFPNRGTSAKGGLGSSTWHTESGNVESQIRSNLFWVFVGMSLNPAKLFNLRP
jgi:outer membrane protease